MVLSARERLAAANRALIAANSAQLGALFGAHRDLFVWPAPQAGSVAFPRYLGADGADAFCRAAREEAGVLLAPGSLWGYPQHFRVGLGRRNGPGAIEALAGWLEARTR